MNLENYTTPQALEAAVKSAARNSGMDVSRAITNFYLHRLLCRIFADDGAPFILKGGMGLLARDNRARATRDIGLVTGELGIDEAEREIKRLASTDLGDFVAFPYKSKRPIRSEDANRDGAKLAFDIYLGTKHLQTVSIDLISDSALSVAGDVVHPDNRIEVQGVITRDYVVYPVEMAVADKICALTERHAGRPSSRVKDLVDIATYAKISDIDPSRLRLALERESEARGISLADGFHMPPEWGGTEQNIYDRLVRQTGFADSFESMGEVEQLVQELVRSSLMMGSSQGLTDEEDLNPSLQALSREAHDNERG